MSMEPSEALAAEEVQCLTTRLSDLKAGWPSEPSLRTLSPRMVDALMARFEDTERRLIPAVRMAEGFYTLLPLALITLVLCIPGLPWHIKLLFTAAMLAFPLCLLYFVCWRNLHLVGGEWAYTVYALTQTEDVRALETLILATHYKWGRDRAVLSAINRLLEQVTEEHIGLLSDRAQKRLWTIGIAQRTLAGAYPSQVTVYVLRTLAAVGNQATMARMERFATRSEYYSGERYAIAAAQELLPLMKERFQRQSVPQTLLRASDARSTQPDTLLRAVHISTPEPTSQLLRASTTEHPETDA